MDFNMTENINLKTLIGILGAEDNLKLNESIEKKLKKELNLFNTEHKNFTKNQTSNIKKDQYLSLFSKLSQINFFSIDTLICSFNYDLLQITKGIIDSGDSNYDSEKSIEKVHCSDDKTNSLDAYLKTMLDIFAFKYILNKLQSITNSVKEKIGNYIDMIREDKEKYSKYFELLLEKFKNIFSLDDLFNFKGAEKFSNNKYGWENFENSIDYLEQSLFSINQFSLADEKIREEDNSFTLKRKSTKTNSRRCSIKNYYNGQLESKSSRLLYQFNDLKDLKLPGLGSIQNNFEKFSPFDNKILYNKKKSGNFNNFSEFRDYFLTLTESTKENNRTEKAKNSCKINFSSNFDAKNMKTQKSLLAIIAELSNYKLINTYQRSLLKELVLDNNEKLIKILQIYEIDGDLESVYENMLRLIGTN